MFINHYHLISKQSIIKKKPDTVTTNVKILWMLVENIPHWKATQSTNRN